MSGIRLLQNGQRLTYKITQDGVYIDVPSQALDPIASVIELEFDSLLPRYRIVPMNK